MDPFDKLFIESLLRTDESGKILQNENDQVEFKEIFDNSSKDAKAKYLKSMAALANTNGGYLIFGVNKKQQLLGLSNFIQPDDAIIVNDINTYFQPTIRFTSKLITLQEKNVYIIYVHKRTSIPIVSIKPFPDVINEASIYWRYSAQSAPIHAGDLIHLLKDLQGEESKKLTELTEREFRSKFKPRFRATGSSSGTEFGVHLENDGEEAIVTSFNITEVNVDVTKLSLHRWQSDVTVRKGSSIKIGGNSPISANDLRFVMRVCFQDVEGFRYEMDVKWERVHAKIIKINEL